MKNGANLNNLDLDDIILKYSFTDSETEKIFFKLSLLGSLILARVISKVDLFINYYELGNNEGLISILNLIAQSF